MLKGIQHDRVYILVKIKRKKKKGKSGCGCWRVGDCVIMKSPSCLNLEIHEDFLAMYAVILAAVLC